MAMSGTFLEQLVVIRADQKRAFALLAAVRAKNRGVLPVDRHDPETLEALALFEDAQRRLSVLFDDTDD